jgi:hypothetical protein
MEAKKLLAILSDQEHGAPHYASLCAPSMPRRQIGA